MSLIDQTYFVADLQIANVDNDSILQRLQFFIDKYEAEFLKNVFGYELYSLLFVELEAKEDDDSYVYSTRFENIINGIEYTGTDNRLHKWRGLTFQNEEGNVKQSCIANYVYWHFVKDQNSQSVGLGEVKAQAQNALNVSPAVKMARAWNEMSTMLSELYYFLDANRETYPEWVNDNHIWRQRQFAPVNIFGI